MHIQSQIQVMMGTDSHLPDLVDGRRGKQARPSTSSSSVTVENDDEDTQMQGDDDNSENYEGDFAPGGDADYFAEEDEEGRFFGGGLSRTQKDILAIFDENEGEEGAEGNDNSTTLTLPAVRRQLLNLERAISKNSELRVKWAGQPDK